MNKQTDVKLIISLIAVAIIWGTTYLGIKIAVETIPPWYITSIRQGIAALIVLMIIIYKKQLSWIGWSNLKMQFIPSILMIVIANGFTTIAEITVPSGLTSILIALSPMVVFIGSLIVGLQKPSLKGLIGVIIGFAGVVFIFKNGLNDILNPNYITGIIFLSIAILSWSSGTIFSKYYIHKSNNITLNLFYQFSIAAIVQYILALIFSPNVNVNLWSLKSVSAVIYLALFGSVLAFLAYYYALKRVTAIQVSVLNYVNTVIAVFLGWLFLDEVITKDILIATFLIIMGVFIINYKRRGAKKIIIKN